MAVENPEDLATLTQLGEETLLDSLITRFHNKQIYTYIGDILVAMNPFKDLPLYDKQVSEKYKNHEKGKQSPHIFAVADRAYQSMQGRLATGPRNQCIVISGESGAGKTESTKLLLHQIMELCRGNTQLEQQILQVNPLLEAFGNAQTVMNDNSSRFGKYIQLRFLNCCVKGAKINEYLLEKSRVVHQDDGERNFHIFYCMFAGISASDKEMYGLLEPALYRYINHKYGSKEMVQHWSMKYRAVCNAMNMVGFEEQEQVDMMTILAGILSLGNIEFEPQDSDGLKITPGSLGWLKAAAGQFGVKEEELQKCLICTMSVTRGESIQRRHTQQQAEDARDSIAKVVYGRVFGWIVSKINELLAPNVDGNVELLEIGILDIFGFENFAVNRFEQLCINLANEQLQYFFNHHIFLMEQREYKEEGLPWEMITFKENKPILDLFLAKPAGILCILDEQTAFPQATDRVFVEKLGSSFKGNNYFQIGRSVIPVFTVVHYAGKVQYTACGFLEKNRDTIPANIRTLFINSVTPLLSVLFAATISRTGTLMPQRKSKQMQALEDNFNTTRKQSVGAQFRHSLMVLMEKMFAASPHFVRCIKPNRCKLPDMVDNQLVMDQLRYNGLLETIRIRRDGFSWRPSFDEFASRYKILLVRSELPPTRESCETILRATDLKGWNVGKSRLFFKYWHEEQLAKCVSRLDRAAVIIQKWYRGFRCQKIYRDLIAEMLKERELEREREMERERQRERELEREREEQHQMELEEERKRELEQEHIAAPVPLPRKKKPQPQPRPRSNASDVIAPPVPRPRSKLTEATPFDNALDHISKKEEARQREMKRTATIRWFKETQMRKVARNGTFPNWFHGMISRREAENLLADKSLGCFLIRVSQNREGYTLTFKGDSRCKHYMIEVQTNGKYVILGEDQAHASLPDLVEYHKNVGIKPYMEVLTVPCGQKNDKESDYEELTHLMKHPVQNNEAFVDLGHLSGEERVHLQLSQMFVPLHPENITVAEKPPILKKIFDKKVGAFSKDALKTLSQNFSDDENQGHHRAIPRLYPSIRLAMREIQQIQKQVHFSLVEPDTCESLPKHAPDSHKLTNP